MELGSEVYTFGKECHGDEKLFACFNVGERSILAFNVNNGIIVQLKRGCLSPPFFEKKGEKKLISINIFNFKFLKCRNFFQKVSASLFCVFFPMR